MRPTVVKRAPSSWELGALVLRLASPQPIASGTKSATSKPIDRAGIIVRPTSHEEERAVHVVSLASRLGFEGGARTAFGRSRSRLLVHWVLQSVVAVGSRAWAHDG